MLSTENCATWTENTNMFVCKYVLFTKNIGKGGESRDLFLHVQACMPPYFFVKAQNADNWVFT